MLQKFFIRPVGGLFAIIAVIDGTEREVERGGKPYIKGNFLNYVSNRNLLIEKIGGIAS